MTSHNAGRPFGIDISSHQGAIDFDKLAAQSGDLYVHFIGIRATMSWGFQDSRYKANWAGAKRIGRLRTAYHVIYPGQPTKNQCDNFFKFIGDDRGELPETLDLELDHGCSAAQIQDSTLSHAIRFFQETGRRPWIYSRKSWMDYFLTGTKWNASARPPAWLSDYDWWLAQYLNAPVEHPGPVMVPLGVSRDDIIIHQTASHTPGQPFGVESLQLDYNRWQFDLQRLYAIAGKQPPGTQPPAQDPPTNEDPPVGGALPVDITLAVQKLRTSIETLREVLDECEAELAGIGEN